MQIWSIHKNLNRSNSTWSFVWAWTRTGLRLWKSQSFGSFAWTTTIGTQIIPRTLTLQLTCPSPDIRGTWELFCRKLSNLLKTTPTHPTVQRPQATQVTEKTALQLLSFHHFNLISSISCVKSILEPSSCSSQNAVALQKPLCESQGLQWSSIDLPIPCLWWICGLDDAATRHCRRTLRPDSASHHVDRQPP